MIEHDYIDQIWLPRVISLSDIYGSRPARELEKRAEEQGCRITGFRIPLLGESYLDAFLAVDQVEESDNFNLPRLILEKLYSDVHLVFDRVSDTVKKGEYAAYAEGDFHTYPVPKYRMSEERPIYRRVK
jgi:hypothetical protein